MKQAVGVQTMSYDDVSTVPLTDELKGSLRAMRPKGVASVLQKATMLAAGDLMAKDRRKRRVYEKPHGAKRIKYVARYKYTTDKKR